MSEKKKSSSKDKKSKRKSKSKKSKLPKVDISEHYTLTNDILGKGYFAQVKVGISKETGEKVAIKIIDKKKVGEAPHMLENEIAILQKVNHPNVVSLKGVFDSSKELFIVMELMEGGELYDEIVRRKQFTEKDCSTVMKQVFSALAYLHQNNIVHRDLKLENLLIKDKDKSSLFIKVADFGLSKLYSGDIMITACGTPFYVAPDILKGAGYGPAIDMWATGVLMYVLLSGRLPFHADNDAELFKLILAGQFIFKSPQFDTISDNAKSLISQLIVQDPSKRLTAVQALQHPFIVGEVQDTPLHESLVKGLSHLNVLSRKKIDEQN